MVAAARHGRLPIPGGTMGLATPGGTVGLPITGQTIEGDALQDQG
jgi:hypothetical protein